MNTTIVDKNVTYYIEELSDLTYSVNKAVHLEIFMVGLKNSHAHIIVNLDHEGASANVNLIAIANDDIKDINVRINNNAKHTKANMILKGIAKNSGICNINATGFIDVDCSGSENYQESRVLLLDNASRGEATPLLLIEHNDVLAGHSASVSRVDEESIYYLQTRGVNKIDAEAILTKAFFQPFLDGCEEEGLEEKIWTI
jgi:Fe-S cluster assembly protein SufD